MPDEKIQDKISEKRVSYRERMVMSEKAGYKVPAFLIGLFDNVPAEEDFLHPIGAPQEEIPLWWHRGISIPMTRGQVKKGKKRSLAIRKAIDMQKKRMDESINSYIRSLAEQEEIFERRSKQLQQLSAEKDKEIRDQFELNDKQYQLRLMELEALLQKEAQETERLKQSADSLIERDKLMELIAKREAVAMDKIEELEKDHREACNLNRIMREELVKLYKERGLSENDDAVQKLEEIKEEIVAAEVAEKENIQNEEEVKTTLLLDSDFYPYEKRVPAYDRNNILEVCDLTIVSRELKEDLISAVNFQVKRTGVTAIYSKNEDTLSLIKSAVLRTLGSDAHIVSGEVRIDGKVTTQMMKEDFHREVIPSIVNLTTVEDALARAKKGFRTVLKEWSYNEKELSIYLKDFNLDQNILGEKPERVSEENRSKLALAFSLTVNKPLIILFSPEDGLNTRDRRALLNALQHKENDSAVLIFTDDISFAAELCNSSLYTIK